MDVHVYITVINEWPIIHLWPWMTHYTCMNFCRFLHAYIYTCRNHRRKSAVFLFITFHYAEVLEPPAVIYKMDVTGFRPISGCLTPIQGIRPTGWDFAMPTGIRRSDQLIQLHQNSYVLQWSVIMTENQSESKMWFMKPLLVEESVEIMIEWYAGENKMISVYMSQYPWLVVRCD